MSKPSKYTITERPDGFLVEGKDRNPVTVTLHPACLELSCQMGNGVSSQECNLYDYYSLSRTIANDLMYFWQPPENKRDSDGRPIWGGVHEWAYKQCAGAIGKRVHAQWQRLLAKADPTVKAVHKAVFAATLRTANYDLIFGEELYRHKWIVSDIINYRAAAIAAANIIDLVTTQKKNTIRTSPELKELEAMATQLRDLAVDYGLSNIIHISLTPENLRYGYTVDTEKALEAMANWRGLFSPDGQPYRSLNRTLMNLPGGIPHSMLPYLNRRHLERPICNRLELLVALFARIVQEPNHNHRVYEHATAGQIKEAMRRVAEHTRNNLSPRRARDVRWLMDFISDYPEAHQGNLVGLADRAILWHRAQQEMDVNQQVKALGGDTKTAEPPIPLPDVPGLRFLATVAEVCQEGLEMQHCIASYARQACHGQCYIFHAEHENDSATVEVGPTGRVIQAHGPRNRINGAAGWAKRQLNRWGQAIPEGAGPIIHRLPPPPELGDDGIPF